MPAIKFNLQDIVSNLKTMLGAVNIPEANQDDPLGYLLMELSKSAQELTDIHDRQAEALAKLNSLLGSIHQANALSNKPDQSDDKVGRE